MKATLGMVKLFLCLVFPAFALQQEILNQDCPLYAGTTFFVNTSGVNSPNCGASSKPCYSISYAVNLAVRKNVSSLTVNISTGKYEELESIKLDCGRWSLRKVTFWGERVDEQLVEVDYSLDVLLCEVSLIDLHWLNSSPVIHQASMSDVAICQCTVKGTNISITGSSSNIILKYSNISSSSGYHPKLPLLSMATLSGFHNFVQILNCNFVKNVGPVLTVENIYQTSIVDSYLEGNKVLAGGSIITGHVSHLKLSGTKFIRNVGHLLFLDDNHSLASLEECDFSCNMVNKSLFLSPVLLQNIHQVSCDDCTVDADCPVLCGPGEFLSSNILCSPCPVGTYSLGTASNKSMLQCTSCPAGTYSSKTRSMQCTRCAKGTFASKTGSSSCTKCKNDFFTSKPGQSSCSSARVGFIVFTVFVSLLIAGPLLILILQKRSREEKCSLCIPRSPSRQRLREDKQPNIYVVQNE